MNMPRSMREDVAQMLESFLDGTCGPWDWDDFISVMRFEDPLLRQIQLRCSRLPEQFPPDDPSEYCNEMGREVIRDYVGRLRA